MSTVRLRFLSNKVAEVVFVSDESPVTVFPASVVIRLSTSDADVNTLAPEIERFVCCLRLMLLNF